MNYFNHKDKRKTRRDVLSEYCQEHFKNQVKTEKMFKSRPNQILIRDCLGQYKIVSKTYYFYNMQNDEYDTEEELLDDDDEKELIRIQNKYNSKKI